MRIKNTIPPIALALAILFVACKRDGAAPPQNAAANSTPNTTLENQSRPIPLPVLNALLADEKFRADLKAKLGLTDEQIAALKKISGEEVAKLRQSDAENQPGSAETVRQAALEAIRTIAGDKTEPLLALARERWEKGSEQLEPA